MTITLGGGGVGICILQAEQKILARRAFHIPYLQKPQKNFSFNTEIRSIVQRCKTSVIMSKLLTNSTKSESQKPMILLCVYASDKTQFLCRLWIYYIFPSTTSSTAYYRRKKFTFQDWVTTSMNTFKEAITIHNIMPQ